MGHEKGAFTGARPAARAELRAGGDGHLLLDEIGDLDPACKKRSSCGSCSKGRSSASAAQQADRSSAPA